MINYKDIEQGSLEWFEIKWAKIGGTLAKGLHTKGDTLFIDILSQSLEEFEPNDGFTNDAMERGTELEPFAVEYVEKYSGLKFEHTGWLQSEENKLLGISPDGITEDETIAVETKCFSRKKHTSILLSNEIPLDNIHQAIHYFTANDKLTKLYWCAFRTESVKHFVKELNLESLVDAGLTKKIKVKEDRGKGKKEYIVAVNDIKPIKEWVRLSKEFAKELDIKIDKTIEELKF